MTKKRTGQSRSIPRTAIEAARASLNAMIAEATPLSYRELVRELFDQIENFRKNGETWQEIQARISKQVPIGLRTLQMYYHEESLRRAAKKR